ncbi:MAG: hypothetical protein ACTTH3_08040 [Schwartzia sp. (in: firmicutes)]
MNVSPISLQMVVPRTTDASQVQSNLNQQAANQQDFAMVRNEVAARQKMEQVQTKDQAEDGKVKDDPNGRNSQGGYHGQRRDRQDQDGGEEERMAADRFRGHNIDISF